MPKNPERNTEADISDISLWTRLFLCIWHVSTLHLRPPCPIDLIKDDNERRQIKDDGKEGIFLWTNIRSASFLTTASSLSVYHWRGKPICVDDDRVRHLEMSNEKFQQREYGRGRKMNRKLGQCYYVNQEIMSQRPRLVANQQCCFLSSVWMVYDPWHGYLWTLASM